jgi:RHS repeat-associated protein
MGLTASLPSGAASEAWIESTVTIPSGGTVLSASLMWQPATAMGEKYYMNDFTITRIVDPVVTTEYQYHLKDHLGNVRMTFTTKDDTDSGTATYETANADQGKFLRNENAKLVYSTLFDHTNDPAGGVSATSGYAERLSGRENEKYGLARSLSVMTGDVVRAEVYAKYIDAAGIDDQSTAGQNLLSLITQVGQGAAGIVIDGAGYATSTSSFFSGGVVNTSGNPSPVKAYLNWIVFNRDFVQIDFGYAPVTSAAATTGTDGPHEKVIMNDIQIREPGYVYIYLSNESTTPVDVFFDDFSVTQVKSPVVQMDDYYPFGLTFNGYQRENLVQQNYLYNGKELQDELNLGWLDYGQRMYDAVLGRWWVIDPISNKMPAWSPYSYAFNNPIRFIDVGGLIPYPITIRSFAPFKTFGGGFHGDNRGYSTDQNASARVHQKINFDTDKTTISAKTWSSPTWHSTAPGFVRTATPEGGIEKGSFKIKSSGDEKNFEFKSNYAGANPLTPGAPDINVFSSLSITENKKEGALNVAGKLTGDNFPSTEAFISDPSGQSVFLGVGFYEGSPFTSLWGENKDRDVASFNLSITTDADGNFTGVKVNDKSFSLAEWNKLFQQADPHKNEKEEEKK